MKKNLLVLLLLFFTLAVSAQSDISKYRTIEIQKENSFNLTTLSSRSYIPIHIPENTNEWFIAFTCSRDDEAISPIGLVAQITSKIDKSGLSSSFANSLSTPKGTASLDVYVTDRDNMLAFMNGSDNYRYFPDVSRKNLTNGIIPVEGHGYTGDYYILLYNESYVTSVNTTLSVVGIVPDASVAAKYDKAIMYGNLGWKQYQNGNLDGAIENSKKALAIDSTLCWVNANMGLYSLIKGNQTIATDFYVDALTLHSLQPETAYEMIEQEIKDIDEALIKFPNLIGSKEIKELMALELQKY